MKEANITDRVTLVTHSLPRTCILSRAGFDVLPLAPAPEDDAGESNRFARWLVVLPTGWRLSWAVFRQDGSVDRLRLTDDLSRARGTWHVGSLRLDLLCRFSPEPTRFLSEPALCRAAVIDASTDDFRWISPVLTPARRDEPLDEYVTRLRTEAADWLDRELNAWRDPLAYW